VTILGKQTVRRLLGLRKFGNYETAERFTLPTLLRAIVAGENTVLDRPVYRDGDHQWHSHMGFNWRAFRKRLSSQLAIEKVFHTPLGATRGIMSSQAWFVCRRDA
jgi:hypothetical protein